MCIRDRSRSVDTIKKHQIKQLQDTLKAVSYTHLDVYKRQDPGQIVKEPCTYCQTNFGYDYYIQPTSPKSTYFKKGRFDDESECA